MMASAVERQPVSSRGSVYSGEIENISDDYALTAGTLCNTDHAGIESSEASFPNYPVTYDIATQVVTPSISRQPAVYEDEVPSSSSSAVGDRFNMPLLFCGAQFDTALPESTEDPELEDLIASMDTHRDNTCFKGSPTMSSEVDNATASIIRTESAVDESLLFQDATPPKCSRVDDSHEPRSGTKLPTYEYERPCIVVHDEEGRPVLPVADDLTPFSVCDDSVTPSAIIENTYLLVKILNTQWIPRLASDDKLHEQCKALPVETLFDVGVKTLRKVYLGILPGTFQDLFALMHIAFAFSLIIYRDGNSCYWDGFSRDVYWWHQALGSTTKEAHLFVQVWHLLWCPQVSRRQGVHEDGFHDTGQSRASPATSNGSTCAEPISSCLNPERFPNPNHDTLGHPSQQEPHDMLMDGMVIKGCSRFLDCEIVLDRDQSIPTDLRSDIEYANIQENKTGCFPGLPRSDPRHLVESIVKPLWRCRAVQLAPEHIADTIEKVLKGDLVNVRQVEVTLISCREV